MSSYPQNYSEPNQLNDNNLHRKTENIVGRSKEYQVLIDGLTSAYNGVKSCVALAGAPGSGKSYLVHELSQPTVEMHGVYVSGKCDKFHQEKPYSVIIQCITQLIDQLYLEDPEKLRNIKDQLELAVGYASGVIVRMIPKMGDLIKSSDYSNPSSSFDFESTFRYAVLQCIRIFTENISPLVMFVDDVQWADNASLKLLKMILSAKELKSILIVYSFRNTEDKGLSANKELSSSFSDKFNLIELTDFTEEEVTSFLLKKYGEFQPSEKLLAGTLKKKTNGNPFFISHLMITLIQNNNIVKDNETGIWRWVIGILEQVPISDNAAVFVEKMFGELSDRYKKILEFMACIGNECDFSILTNIEPDFEIKEAEMNWLIKKGFLIKNQNNNTYSFSHDRIKTAAFNNITNSMEESIHWRIGQALLLKGEDWVSDNTIRVINHLNKGLCFISGEEEAHKLINLNRNAGKEAMLSIAYNDALTYGKVCIDISEIYQLPDTEYQDLLLETARYSQLACNYNLMHSYIDKIRERKNLLYILKSEEVHIGALLAQRKYHEAYEVTRKALKGLNISLPQNVSKAGVVADILKTEFVIGYNGIEKFKELQKCTDDKIISACRLISLIFPALIYYKHELVPSIACKWVRIILDKGLTQDSPFALTVYSVILCGYAGKIKKAAVLAEIVKDILNSHEYEGYAKYRSLAAISNNVLHLKYGTEPFYDEVATSFYRALQFGDHEFAGFSVACRVYYAYEAGETLEEGKTGETIRVVNSYSTAPQK